MGISGDNIDAIFNDVLGTSLGIIKGGGYSAIDKTSFGGDIEDKRLFFTGKPYVEDLGYTFLFRNYRSDLGKWQIRDPIGYPRRLEQYNIMKKFSFFLMLFIFIATLFAEGQIGYVEVQGKGKENRNCKIWYRVPSSYKENSKSKFRVLVFFGGRNFSGDKQLNKPDWNDFADELGIFIVSPSFVNEDYWLGKGWSGRALIEGLRKIKNLYNISDENLFFYGYSAGGQCSNLFPAAMPERTRAYVSHASGVFHKPNPNMMGIPALLTCGDADHARYVINKKFIGDYRKLGVNILWKSFYNHTHDIPSASQKLARDFFRYCHRKYERDLYSAAPSFAEPSKILYVGDDIDGTLYDADSPAAKNVDPYDAVYFTSEEMACAWAKAAKME